MAANYPPDSHLNHLRSGASPAQRLATSVVAASAAGPASAARPDPQAGPGQGQHRQPAPQPLQQPAGHLLGALLFAHEGVQHKAVPVSPGISHCSTVSCRCAPARSRGVASEGVVPPSTGASPACISRSPSAREQAVAANARPVTVALATVALATPCWVARRPLLPASSTAPPA